MKVMVVGGNQMKYAASRYYDFANKLSNGFVRNGHNVIRFLDRDSARMSNMLRSRKLGVSKANQVLMAQALSFRPSLILFFHADVIQKDTLRELTERLPETRLAQVSLDPLFMPGNVERLSAKSPLLHATFVSTAGDGLKKVSGGKPAYYIPNITDPSMETGRAFQADCDIDLIFACGSFDREGGDPRKAALDVIAEKLPDINFARYVDHETGGLWGAEHMEQMGRSKCGLNMSREREGPLNLAKPEDLYIYSSDRVSFLTGNGVLTFTHRKYDLGHLFTDDEMVFYESNEDLADKIAYYLKNDAERRRIAEGGWRKAHEEINERLCAQYMEEVLFGKELSHPYIWPTESVV